MSKYAGPNPDGTPGSFYPSDEELAEAERERIQSIQAFSNGIRDWRASAASRSIMGRRVLWEFIGKPALFAAGGVAVGAVVADIAYTAEYYSVARTIYSARATSTAGAVNTADIAAQSSSSARVLRGATIVERDGNVVIVTFRGSAGEARVITELVRVGDTLILRGAHIEGAASLREAIKAAAQFGREQGAKRVIIEGGRRTTGANPGHMPRPITVETGL
jgi:hypothetical protein